MLLGTEVDLGPGHIVLDGDPVPLLVRGAQQPPHLFGACLLWSRLAISATTELLCNFPVDILYASDKYNRFDFTDQPQRMKLNTCKRLG